MLKKKILENVDMYSADELVKYIKDGVVTLDELCNETDGCFSTSVRKEVNRIIAGSGDNNRLQTKSPCTIDTNNSIKFNKLIETNSSHEVLKLLLNGEISIAKEDFLSCLTEDHNLVDSHTFRQLIDNAYISVEESLKAGINEDFINRLFMSDYTHSFCSCPQTHKLPDNRVAEEFYLFGLPYVGKTSMLSLLLLSLNSFKDIQKVDIPVDTDGTSYSICLRSLFSTSGVSTYPIRVHALIDETNHFDLNIKYCNLEQKFRFINFNDNLAFCLSKRDFADIEAIEKENAYIDYKKMLIENRSINRKHFLFVIPYETHDAKYFSLRIQSYYEGMLNAMKEDGVFKSNIDRVSIIITKVDRIQDKENVYPVANNYLQKSWSSFYHNLEYICKVYDINGGFFSTIPFSCGESCLQDFVKIDLSYSEKLIRNLILNQIPSEPPKGRLFKFIHTFLK